MASRVVWSGVSVAVQSALGTAVPVSAVTNAKPGVASAGTTPTQGDIVLMNATGMTQIDQRAFRVGTVVAGTSFQLEGEDCTQYGTFSTGSYQKFTFGNSLGGVASLSVSGGDVNWIDVTSISDTVKREQAGLANALTYSLEALWDPSDAGLKALRAAFNVKGALGFGFTFPSGQKVYGYADVGASMAPTGNAQDKVTTPIELKMRGWPSAYST